MLTHARKEATISPQKSRPTAEACRKLKKNRQLLLLMTLQLHQRRFSPDVLFSGKVF